MGTTKWGKTKEAKFQLKDLSQQFWVKEVGTSVYCPISLNSHEVIVGLAITEIPTKGEIVGEFQLFRERIDISYFDGTFVSRSFGERGN